MQKFVGQKWVIKSGLLYAGLNERLEIILCGADDPRIQIFDSRDSCEAKLKFYRFFLPKVEVECVS